ncbi:MAG: lipopolysaccharide biosynthesis protein [Muribaculaceae bacterium]|nr:lipopolysaccharide biosynthesis protein [Muribaculaceae bacterium]
MSKEDNKRIAKNTFFLYVRMILTIAVNFYAIRVIWKVLGVDDYGIYGLVGGIVATFAFINNAMVASSQRFISFELGRGNTERLNKVFCLSVTVHFMLALAITVLAETGGLWLLNERLNIQQDRMYAANWVFQCSVLAFAVNVISVPYNACIVAHEHMKAYGYFGILEVLLKLAIVFLLIILPFDKLITYSLLILGVTGIMRIIYGVYCRKHFPEARYRFVTDHHLMRDMFSFAGWSFVGNLGFSVRDQGLNIVLNLLFNTALNAVRTISMQIGGTISGFAQNFQMAINPQITKRYASGEIGPMMNLVFAGCRYSVILMMMVVVPFLFATEQVLRLWLDDVAPYTVGFTRLVLVMLLIEAMGNSVTTALQATGRIKWFQIIVSVIMVANIPIAWIWMKLDTDPYVIYYVSILTAVAALLARLVLLKRDVGFRASEFFYRVLVRTALTLILSCVAVYWIRSIFPQSFWGLVLFAIMSVGTMALISFLVGINSGERKIVISYIKNHTGRHS